MLYRGWTIEKFEGTQIGHKTNSGLRGKLGFRTHRKVKGWELRGPDGGAKCVDTLKEAKAYIDTYEAKDPLMAQGPSKTAKANVLTAEELIAYGESLADFRPLPVENGEIE